ncbi:hypothetical protein FYK55_25035 [Roseiconus nitratireducens]|uniref:Sialate O-acetylesterase domain-containing protein n=1 Tax=Roseiconus nitratireducens TaxID=2605748 RepID=A0A5M6CVB0_9BACT|nr:sialate O-acetylesterase [Roseiconus nitratireducens]KAA5539188.1 hypothetical protein FYK55_25035 [Roseiconus nitratireducens]
MKSDHRQKRILPIALTLLFAIGFGGRADAEPNGPLKVFILAGQSNMQGHAQVETFEAMRLNPKAAPLLKDMVGPNGEPIVCERVWISSIGSSDQVQSGRLTAGFGAQAKGPKIGPEFTFGIYMQQHLNEPILIIKTAWGGKSLHTDFRPPGAGPYTFTESQLETFQKQNKDLDQLKTEKAQATGHYYRMMMDHIRSVLDDIPSVYPDYDSASGYELSGFVWFQGWNDMVDRGVYPNRDQPGGYDAYGELLAQLIRDVRKDLDVPRLPFVIGVMGVGGPTDQYGPDQQRYKGVHQNFRDAMAFPASLPEFEGSVATVLTENYWDQKVARLRDREKEIQPEVKELQEAIKSGKISREQGQQQIDALYAKTFNDRELEILQDSTSNFDFHYMGSAGILAQIGKGFADAMATLLP